MDSKKRKSEVVSIIGVYMEKIPFSDAYLELTLDMKSPSKKYSISKTFFAIGRSNECEITLNDPVASRVHAAIIFESDEFYICDCDSSNGTLVNSIRIEPFKRYRLKNEDRISIGEWVFHFIARREFYLSDDESERLIPKDEFNEIDLVDGLDVSHEPTQKMERRRWS